MKVSVAIPAYNCAATIQATLESVLQQTAPPDEILVLDDGSTDNTASVVNSYRPRVTLFQQKNSGAACARNALCERAQGDLIAFIDSDDIWNPSYLEVQRRLFRNYPNAVAFFTGHVNFVGHGNYQWDTNSLDAGSSVELIDPLDFFERYNRATGPFASMSYCCVPKRALMQIGNKPFCEKVSGVEDSYLFYLLALSGPVVYASKPLVAYRITDESLSANHLKTFRVWVHVFELLQGRYRKLSDANLSRAFGMAFASKRRFYAKLLMGAGKTSEARRQLQCSLGNTCNPVSIVKSLAWLLLTYIPVELQPKWRSSHR